MEQVVKIIACGIVYFLIVYLFVIRREARPVIPWAVCITFQTVCAVFFYDLVEFVKYYLPEEQYGSLGIVIPSAILCFGNILLILLMFCLPKETNTNTADDEQTFRIAPLPSATSSADTNSNEADITISFIRRMISDGRTEEALKYLKMLAYYSKDEYTRAEAKRMIASLTTVEE